MSEDYAARADAVMASAAFEKEDFDRRVGTQTVREHTSSCASYRLVTVSGQHASNNDIVESSDILDIKTLFKRCSDFVYADRRISREAVPHLYGLKKRAPSFKYRNVEAHQDITLSAGPALSLLLCNSNAGSRLFYQWMNGFGQIKLAPVF